RREASRSRAGSWAMAPLGSVKSKSAMCIRLEQLLLPRQALGRQPAQVLVGAPGDRAAARRAVEEADLQQVGLVHVLEGVRLLADRGGQRVHPHRTAAELVDDGE